MTELSFNDQSNQVKNETKVEDTAISEDEGYCEKHVRINDEDLPVVYKPKSYSHLTDDTTNYEHIIHQHPALKFSICNTHIDKNAYFPSSKLFSSPFTQRRNKILIGGGDTISISSTPTASPQWDKKDITRKRGRTFPTYADVDNINNEQTTDQVGKTNTKNRINNNNSSPKWLNFFKKMNVFPKIQRIKSRSRRSKNTSFHDLPPIRVSLSVDNLDLADEETNNNYEANHHLGQSNYHHESHIFAHTKSYRPDQCTRKSSKTGVIGDGFDGKPVALKRVNSLPIL